MKKTMLQTLVALTVPLLLEAKTFSPGAVSRFTFSGNQSATIVGFSDVQWSDFSGTDAFGAKVFVDANIVDAEKTDGVQMKDDDTWCGPLSDMDALFWTGWAQAKTSYATVDDMANYFRADPTLLRTWNGSQPVEGTYGYDGLFNWFRDQTGVDLNSRVTYGNVGSTFSSSIRGLLDDGSHVIRLSVLFVTTSNPRWSWCNAYGGVSHAVLCVGYVADTSKDASDPSSLKALFIVDPDNSQSTNGGGVGAPNTIAYCPVGWNGSAYTITGIWGETSEIMSDYSALANYSSDDSMSSALDAEYLSFAQVRSDGTAKTWFELPNVGYNDSLMAISDMPAGTWSSITTTVAGPCVVDWGWLCAPGSESAMLSFYCDDEFQFNAADASSEIVYPAFYVPAGTHKLEWCYVQGSTKTGDGTDIAALDWVAVYYPVTFTATSLAVEPPPAAYTSQEGVKFYLVGSILDMPVADVNWECDYDGNVYGSGAGFRMPMAPVEFMAIENGGAAYDASTFAFGYASFSAVTDKGAWNGFVMDGYGAVVGLIDVKAAALKNSKSKVTFTVTMLDKKKFKVKGEMSLNLGDGPDCTAVGGGTVITAYFRHQNVWGTVGGYYFDCARDCSSDKGAAAEAYKSRLNAAKANYVLSVLSIPQSGKLEMGNGFVGLSLSVGAKGKTKVTGVLPDGMKVNSTVYMAADDVGLWIPVWGQLKKGYFGGHILSMATLRADRDKIGDWHNESMHSFLMFDDASRVTASRPASAAMAFYLPSSYGSYPTAIDGSSVLMASLPSYAAITAVQFSNNKWMPLSNDSCKLKLTYVPKTGLIKGNFTIFTANNKKYKANVNGAYINGWGDCNAGVKGKVTMPMIIGPF